MDADEIRTRLDRLHAEWLEAKDVGLTACPAYVRDLRAEMRACDAALVGARVTELAISRAERSGRLVG